MNYREKFDNALKHFGYKSIKDIPDEKKDDFFNYLDATHAAKNESEKEDILAVKKEVDKVAKEIIKDKKDEGTTTRKQKIVENVLRAYRTK